MWMRGSRLAGESDAVHDRRGEPVRELTCTNERLFLTEPCRSPIPTSRPRLIRNASFLEADRCEIALR